MPDQILSGEIRIYEHYASWQDKKKTLQINTRVIPKPQPDVYYKSDIYYDVVLLPNPLDSSKHPVFIPNKKDAACWAFQPQRYPLILILIRGGKNFKEDETMEIVEIQSLKMLGYFGADWLLKDFSELNKSSIKWVNF